MGLVRAWRRQIYGASLIAVLIPAAIIAALFVATGGGPLHGLGTLGQVFSGPASPGGNLSARVSESSKPALPGSGGAGAAALRGHSPVLGQALVAGSPGVRAVAGPHGSALAPLKLGTTTPSSPGHGGQLHGGSGAGGGGAGGGPSPRPPVSTPPTTPTTTTTAATTTTDTTTAASLPPIVAIPPSPVTTTTATTTTAPPVHTTTTTTTTRTTTTSTTKTTTTPTTKTTTTSTTKTTTTPTTKTTTTPTTKTTTTTTTTVTHTTTTIKAPTTKTGTHPIESVVPTVATTVAQAEHGSAVFTGCTGDWGVSAAGHLGRVARAAAARRL
jgi:hypothetical protein